MLQRGSKGSEVKELQARLNYLGYTDDNGSKLSEDGSFGPATEQAVNRFKDAVIPGGNEEGGPWRGQVGDTTWEALKTADPIDDFSTPDMPFMPPLEYNTPPGKKWNQQSLDWFKKTESGVTVIWEGAKAKLIAARDNFLTECKRRGWNVRFTSAKRPLIQQAHFYDIRKGPASKTVSGRAHADRHGLSQSVSYPSLTAPHIAGIAFDAIITNANGRRLNPMTGPINPELLDIAHKCGFKTPPSNDCVHWQVTQ